MDIYMQQFNKKSLFVKYSFTIRITASIDPCRQLSFEDSDHRNDNGFQEEKTMKRSTSWKEGKFNKSDWEVTKSTVDGSVRVVDLYTGEEHNYCS